VAGAAISTEATVLRTVPFRDADLVVTLFTRSHGKLSALARSARRSRRRFGGGLALFTAGEAILRPGRAELWTLSELRPLRDLSRLASDVVAVAHGSYAAELVRELCPPEQADQRVFDLLLAFYDVVAARGPSLGALRAFELSLLEAVGLAPELDACVGCGASAPERLDAEGATLDGHRGGVACPACSQPGARAVRALPAAARALLKAAREAPDLLHAVELSRPAPAPVAAAAREAMVAFVVEQVGKPLKSLEFLAKLRGAAGR
jgi:DNA repair protein RecO (recombination protein O)